MKNLKNLSFVGLGANMRGTCLCMELISLSSSTSYIHKFERQVWISPHVMSGAMTFHVILNSHQRRCDFSPSRLNNSKLEIWRVKKKCENFCIFQKEIDPMMSRCHWTALSRLRAMTLQSSLTPWHLTSENSDSRKCETFSGLFWIQSHHGAIRL